MAGAGASGAILATQQFSALGWLLQAPGDTTRTSFRLIRAEDQMIVDVDLLDAIVSGNDIVSAGSNPGLRFTFGSQHTAEEPLDGQPTYPDLPASPPTPLAHRVAETSRIVVDINTPIPFSVSSILNLSGRVPRVDGRATNTGTPPPLTQRPALDVTSIEMPTDLVLSNNTVGRWFTDATPQTFDDVSEAWRIRLGRQVNGSPVEAPETFGVVRAIFTDEDSDPSPLAVLQAADRAKIVALTAQQTAPADPIVFAPVDRLWLSPAGGRLETEVVFSPSNTAGLISWAQKIVTGRDVFATVVKQGYILPWGLPAAVIEQTERQFVATTGGNGGITAAMVRNDYLVTAPLDIDTPPGSFHDGRGTPFPTMSMASTEPTALHRGDAGINPVTEGFWVELAGGSNPLMQIPVEMTDHAGRRHDMKLPGIFMYSTTANDTDPGGVVQTAVAAWNNRAEDDRSTSVGGSKVAWAPERSEGAATRSTETIRMKAYTRADGGDANNGVPAFGPLVDEAWIVDEVVNGLAGVVGEAIKVIPDPLYLINGDTNGSGGNPAGNFLEVAEVESFVQDAVTGDGGGLVAPSFDFKGLSQSFGAGPALGPGGEWDPTEQLAGIGGKLLGAVDFADLLEPVFLAGAGLADFEIPRFILEPPTIPDELCYRFYWETKLSTWAPPGSNSDVFLNAADSGFGGETLAYIESVSCISTSTGEASSSVDVRIENFGLQLPPVIPAIQINFSDLRYEQRVGQEADTTVKITDIEFVGILAWLDPIAALLGDLSDTFGIDIDLTSITAEGKLPIPDIDLGIMGISDLEPSFAVTLPFTGDPLSMSMAIGTKQDPFSIFVFSAGGGAYVEIDTTANGIERLAVGFFVTYTYGVDVAVAEVTIAGTIGGGMEIAGNDISFNLFIQVRGTVAAFGMSVFLEARIDLEYSIKDGDHVLTGTAKVTVGFDTPLGQASVSFTLTQEVSLGSSNGAQNAALPPPAGFRRRARMAPANGASFGDRFTTNQWNNYCGAFA